MFAFELPGSRVVVWLLIVVFTFIGAIQVLSQEKKLTQKPVGEEEVVSVKTNLVNIDVMVKDQKGKYISDLKAEDFTVFENGVQQNLEFFDPPLVRGSETGKRAPGTITMTGTSGVNPPRNIISLVLDGQTTDLTNLKQVREGTIKYINEQISEDDSVALFAVTSDLRLLQTFTEDKQKLISAVENAYAVSNSSKNLEQRDIAQNISELREQVRNAEGASAGATTSAQGSVAGQGMIAARVLQQYIKLRTVLGLQQSRPILAALAAICESLLPIPGKKTLVLFSQGFVTPAVLDWQVQSTIDLANRANVAIYIVDSSGLKAAPPQSGSLFPAGGLSSISAITSQEQRIQSAGGETVFDNARHEGENREYDILYRMSGDTGGRFIKGSNDIAKGLQRIDQEIRSRYTLAYRSTDQNFDGGFRKLKVEVRRPGAEVISRPGYYAIAREDIVPLSPDDKKLLAAFVGAEANPGLPVFVELDSFRSEHGLYRIAMSAEFPPDGLRFEQKADKRWLQLDVLGVIRSGQERIFSRLGGNFDVGLSSEQYQSIVDNNLFYRQDLDLPAGTYNLDLIVRDRRSGKITARRQKLLLPEADSEFATSAVMLSRHVEAIKPGATEGDVAAVEIRPSPSREFRASDNLIIFFEVYNAATNRDTAKALVRATVRLMRDGQPVTRPLDYVLTDLSNRPPPHLTFAKFISLSGMQSGRYTAMIEVKDMVSHKVVRHEETFSIAKAPSSAASHVK